MDIKLVYVLLTPGNTSVQSIELKVTPTVQLADAKDLICESHEIELECQNIGRDDIKIFVPVDVKIQPFPDLLERLQHKLASLQPHMLTDSIQSIFGEQQPDFNYVHLVALTSKVLEERDTVHELSAVKGKAVLEERMRLIDAAAADVSPSTGVSTSENIKAAYNAVHAGRPALNYGPPTSIFSPQLARLSDRLQNLHSVEPSALYLKHSHEYIVHATDFYGKEMDWETNLKTTIDDILGAEGQWQHQFANKKAKPDATWGMPIYVVYEGKNENGQGDASLQGILVYRKMLTLPDSRAVMQYSNCPIILIGTMANRLEISAAIFTDGIYADKLVSLDLLLGFDGEENVLRLARILHVLAISAQEICAHYEEARNNPPLDLIAVVLPDPTPVLGETLPKLTFKSKLSRSNKALDIVKTDAERCHGLYLATMPQPPPVGSNPSSEALREVMVKFTKRYNPEAHRLLAAEGLAPALHACSQVLGGLYMVVMDRIRDGQPLELCRNRISQTVYDDVKKAVSLLHAENIVFGDLRLPNIMLLPSGRAMLVDFDWADADGKGRYSSMLNDSLVDHWAPGVQRRAIMTKEHDIFMLERLKDAANMLMPRSGATGINRR